MEPEGGLVRYLGDVQRLELRPDDIVVLSVREHLSSEKSQNIKQYMEQAIGRRVLVLGKGMRVGVLDKGTPVDGFSKEAIGP